MGTITLDRETFKALAADTRIDILKNLEKRKLTLTDLSEKMGMSPSNIKEHLDKLVDAGLIEPIDKGTKWKYYHLTRKGENIVSPNETKVWILLGTSLAVIGASALSVASKIFDIAGGLGFGGMSKSMKAGELIPIAPQLSEAREPGANIIAQVANEIAKEDSPINQTAKNLMAEVPKVMTRQTERLEAAYTNGGEALSDMAQAVNSTIGKAASVIQEGSSDMANQATSMPVVERAITTTTTLAQHQITTDGLHDPVLILSTTLLFLSFACFFACVIFLTYKWNLRRKRD